jgi:hypothetical protein
MSYKGSAVGSNCGQGGGKLQESKPCGAGAWFDKQGARSSQQREKAREKGERERERERESFIVTKHYTQREEYN